MINPEHRAVSDHTTAAAKARAQRGSWVLAGVYANSQTSKSVAAGIRAGSPSFPTYQPTGAFDAYAAPAGDRESVWVRYVEGDEPLPPFPDRMTVRVRHSDPAPSDLGVVTVTVATRCPACGGPRGWDTIQPYSFQVGDEEYTADTWTNPCGHMDLYPHVLEESRTRQLPPPPPPKHIVEVKAPQEPPQVELILAAARERRGMHAAQAADLLEIRGFADDAALIRAEVKNRAGHMSAKQAATLLRDLARSAHYQTGAAS
ncbi:hypothetical protein ACFV1C_00480 [Streptomyces sp. NPDC059605]|uniref:hypothetical protein n=1 Tax=Streptomyces sp. NPDC059605 TaxID=3346882 RepID=UPI0036D1303B